jgi:inhibitor of cysteine peptidase
MLGIKRRCALLGLLLPVLAGCGLSGPKTYELHETRVQVEVGEEFTLKAPVAITMGEHWGMAAPGPDASVVRKIGRRKTVESDPDLVGDGTETDFFDFKAVGPGTTKIRLIQCPYGACVGTKGKESPSPSPTSTTAHPDRTATVHAYTVTVRKP